MTAPSYTEDLTDVDLAANDTNWEECNASGWNTGGASTYDTDYPYIQGSGAVTQLSTKAAIGGLMVDNSTGITLPTDGAYFVWQVFASNRALDTFANGGMRVVVGSDRDNFYSWDVGGSDKGRYPYGGWMNHACNTGETSDDTVGSPTSTERYIGAAYKSLAAIGKGNPHGVDAIRYGRGSSIFEHGDLTNGYCTLAGYAAQNDADANKWGLIQAIPGAYLYKGKMTLGTATNAVDFRDSNALVLIDDTPKVTTNFNTIEVLNSSSRVDMTNIIFKSLGTQSPGRWVTSANADLNLDACQFFDMSGGFGLGGLASEFLNCIWKNCGTITLQSGGKLNGSQILTPPIAANTSAVLWMNNSDPDGSLDNLSISKGTNAHHAIGFGNGTPLTMTIRGCDFSGFNASDAQNDSTFNIGRTSGTVTINCVGCTGNLSYKTAGATVNIVPDPATIKVTAKTATGALIQNARVMLKCADATGPFHYDVTVTAVWALGVVVVSHTGHNVKNGDFVVISGCDKDPVNGVKEVQGADTDEYGFLLTGDPGTLGGTIKSTAVPLYGLTDVNGEIEDSRVYSSDQNVTGWARKGSSSPFYKTAPITETVDKDNGLSTTAILILDE